MTADEILDEAKELRNDASQGMEVGDAYFALLDIVIKLIEALIDEKIRRALR